MSIQRLPGDVAVQIQSSTTVTSLNDAVLGLLKNSLDAGARKVTITVDYSRGACTVEDDGVGIAPEEFGVSGGLGKRCYTSKHPRSPQLYGRHGLFLASVGALSLLTISSRCQGQAMQASMTMHNDMVLSRHVPDTGLPSAESALPPLPRGTRVAVRDLFGCMPVRARLRPSPASCEWTRDWDSLVRATTAVLLAVPTDVTVSLKDQGSTSKRLLRAEDTGTTRAARLLAQAGLSNTADPASWVTIAASVPGCTLSGCVSLASVASKKAQFIRLGIAPLAQGGMASCLYSEINSMFSASNFGAATGRKETGTAGAIAFTREQRPRKAVDRWPMFSIAIDLDDDADADNVLDDQRRHLDVIKALLQTAVGEFLKKNGFYEEPRALYGKAQKQAKKPRLARHIPNRAHTPSSASLFSSWPQTKHTYKPRKQAAVQSTVIHQGQKEETSKFFNDPCPEGECAREGTHDHATEVDAWDRDSNASGAMRISRASLASARVVGQVDCKYILVQAPVVRDGSVSTTDESVLILVDQHAADERCRVEGLLRELVDRTRDNATVLARPLHFELPSHELAVLDRHRAYFGRWGIHYEVSLPPPDSNDALLRVSRLPASIADRCTQEPRLVMDILRSEAGRAGTTVTGALLPSDDVSWVARLHGCPRGILDLVNSRACQSAIKFNDPLTHSDCVDLLNRLRACSFPFQCAHGRPSMVPVLNLG